MNGMQYRKGQKIEKPFPGCLGRMVNLFDLSNGVAGNRLLTDKPHHDGSSISRSQSDVARMLSLPVGDQVEDKMIVSELRRSSLNKKANATPMKTLIAQEMSKEVESKHNPPNLVAKLMGLDSLPHQQPVAADAQRSHSRGSSRRSLSHSGIFVESWDEDHSCLDKQMPSEGRLCQEQSEYKDVYEIWQQSQKTMVRHSSPQKRNHNENVNTKKMALVCQKFMEAKRLSTDEKGRQSKEFQDALEVLSSNKDLFLKFLQEPNSLFSQHLHDMQSMPPSPETKHITVLRPSKVVDDERFAGSGKKSDKPTKQQAHTGQATGWESNLGYSPAFSNEKIVEYPPAQPTRIVVLKPSPGKIHDIKALVSPPSSPPRMLHGEDFYDEPEDVEAQEPREVAKLITRNMRENLMGHRRDETLLSSVYSNGYTGDDSSFNKSVNDYAVENLSDTEIMSPTSRHSWDYINRFDSPYSTSSFSRASCSPESSVCREAKKRLSERWAMMASNGRALEQKNARRSSSTLGEMLALSDTKKFMRAEEEDSIKEQQPRGSTSCITSHLNKEDGTADSPRTLLRSKSLPVSTTVHVARPNVEVSPPDAEKTEVLKDLTRAKSVKSSLKGKVSSLFFSRNKKPSKDKSVACQSKDEFQSAIPETPSLPIPLTEKVSDGAAQCTNNSGHEKCSSHGLHAPAGIHTYPDFISMETKQDIVSHEGGLSVTKPVVPGNMNENQDQPSPISVLEPPFEEDDNTILEASGLIQKPDCRGIEVPLKSNLIGKSPPIESVARTLTWDNSCAETASSYPLKPSPSPVSLGAEEDEKYWFSFVQTLLTAAGLDCEVQLDSFFSRWHSPESPLDPQLRDKYANPNDKELLHEAKRRQRRSNQKLVFDCVNAALVEITGHGSDRSTRAVTCSGVQNRLVEDAQPMVAEYVWAQMKEWFCSDVRCASGDGGGDSNSLVVEMVVRKEVVGKGWIDKMRAELDTLRNEIEGKLLDELVEETVTDFAGRM
ncbi:uncharacterized protein LOC133692842 isoform X1 [Populus nigra]|uniref:uncharacterized protein LOC133692842 isoform X1 n=1 Tax=Populus nigra TaxID=3691 RepID=UPI002B26AF0E|nr:uncharacterized protein LOC133692842 isoform X1 [Populus nigra]XP_061969979.1 uncharacterized protein LOC133692842 isoform X1 [Populus nigra]